MDHLKASCWAALTEHVMAIYWVVQKDENLAVKKVFLQADVRENHLVAYLVCWKEQKRVGLMANLRVEPMESILAVSLENHLALRWETEFFHTRAYSWA